MNASDTKDPEAERSLETMARRQFDQSVEQLDAKTRTRLAKARARALAEQADSSSLPAPWVWLPGGAAAVAAALWLVLPVERAPEAPLQAVALADLDILLGDEDLELLEDLEFYTWLDELPEFATEDPADDGVG